MMAAQLSDQLTAHYAIHGKTGQVQLTHNWKSPRDGKEKTTQYTYDLDQMNRKNHDTWKKRPIIYVRMLVLPGGPPSEAPSATATPMQ